MRSIFLRITPAIFVSCFVVLSYLFPVACGAAEIPRGPLDEIWNSHMLDGTSSIYEDGKRSDYVPHASFDGGDGSPDAVWSTTRGIRVSDLRETSGLLSKGGWRLEGGLLGRVESSGAMVELYGKSVWRVPPSLLHFGKSPPRSAQHSYEFFLLLRRSGPSRAMTLKKWVVESDRIPYDYYLKGKLEYKPGANAMAVTVLGRDDGRVFVEERIAVPGDLSR